MELIPTGDRAIWLSISKESHGAKLAFHWSKYYVKTKLLHVQEMEQFGCYVVVKMWEIEQNGTEKLFL